MSCTKTKSTFLAIFIIVFFNVNTLFAEPVRVAKDRYIITLKNSGLRTNDTRTVSNNLATLGAEVKEHLDSSILVVGPEHLGLRSASAEFITYDPLDPFCTYLLQSGIAEFCSPDFEVNIDAVPNDASYGDLWGMHGEYGIQAEEAWDISKDSEDVVIAVIDTGIDYNHPDLRANIWTNPGEIPGDGIDNDGNGYIDDVHGWNARDNNGNPMDNYGHGTHVAGTIGAVGDNGLGVTGVAWKTKMIAVKFIENRNTGGRLSDAIKSIQYINKLKRDGVNIRVSNNSWGGGPFVQALYRVIQESVDLGILFIAAAGNDKVDNDEIPHYPSSYEIDRIVSVAAIRSDGLLASDFSNWGYESVDIAAPGEAILSTYPGGQYASIRGTSMATPHVTGALALLISNEPNISEDEAITRLYQGGVGLNSLSGKIWSGRTLNVNRMLRNLGSPVLPPSGIECEYEMEAITYDPPRDADLKTPVMQADEYNFYKLDLPFDFPYFGKTVSSVWISPNGVVYVSEERPNQMDYAPEDKAELKTIAALQTDLFAAEDPLGVRVFSNGDRAVIAWKVKHYAKRSNADADVEIHLELHKSGRVYNYVSFNDSEEVEKEVQKRSLIGLAGPNLSDRYTAAVDSDVVDGFSLAYIPHCTEPEPREPPAVVTAVDLYASNKKGKRKNFVISGKKAEFDVLGTGTTATTVKVGDGKRFCSAPGSLGLVQGSANYSVRLNRIFWKKFQVEVNQVKSDLRRLKIPKKLKKAYLSKKKKISRKISDNKFERQCDKILKTLVQQ